MTGAKGPIEFLGLASDNASIDTVNSREEICGNFTNATVQFTNQGVTEITSLELSYDINGGTPMTETWYGSIDYYETADIELTGIDVTGIPTGVINVSIASVNGNTDSVVSDNTGMTEFEQTTVFTTGADYTLTVVQDQYGSEITWDILDDSNNVVVSGGPYSDLSASGTQEHVESITLSAAGCYTVFMKDSYGDGFNGTSGAGSYTFKDELGAEVIHSNAQFGKEELKPFNLTEVAIGIVENNQEFTLFPNSTHESFTIKGTVDGNAKVDVFNSLGQSVISQSNFDFSQGKSIDVSALKTGVYYVNVSTENGTSSQRLVIE